jgi:hypothetical protein
MTNELVSRLRVLYGIADVFSTPPGRNDAALGGSEWRKALAETITASIKSATGEYVKEQFKGAGQELLRAIVEETAQSLVESIAGPLIRLAFRLIDTSGKKVDKLVSEPLATGLRVGSEALKTRSESVGDKELTTRRLQFALEKLDSAYTLADIGDADSKFYIRFFQGLIASGLHSTAYTKLYFSDCLPLLDSRGREYEQRAKQLVLKSAMLRDLAAKRQKRQPIELFPSSDGFGFEPPPVAELPLSLEMRADYYDLDQDNVKTPAVLRTMSERCASAASSYVQREEAIQELIACMEAAANC